MRLLIEASYVFDHPHMKSGIQRVVRNIVKNLDTVDTEHELIPIAFRSNKVLKINQLEPTPIYKFLAPIRTNLEGFRNHYWLILGKLEQFTPFKQSLTMRRLLFAAMKLGSLSYIIPLRLIEFLTENILDYQRAEDFIIEHDDVLVLLDSSWHGHFFDRVNNLKAEGVVILAIVYDLIPLTHPQFCDEHLVKVFENWFDWIGSVSDGYMAISNTIRDQVKTYMLERMGEEAVSNHWFSSFYLGSDLDGRKSNGHVRKQLVDMYASDSPIYITVSTIEPRKNHAYQLDAFEGMWQQGSNVCLCIIGKVGWKCAELIDRIRGHAELNSRLFMFNDLGDDELSYAYDHSRALLFTSYVEGFGLPLVEARSRGLRVICSDIPVFREVGQNAIAYCDLADPSSLVAVIQDFENSGYFPVEEMEGVAWQSWPQSAQQFIDRISIEI